MGTGTHFSGKRVYQDPIKRNQTFPQIFDCRRYSYTHMDGNPVNQDRPTLLLGRSVIRSQKNGGAVQNVPYANYGASSGFNGGGKCRPCQLVQGPVLVGPLTALGSLSFSVR